eukprot:3122626-Alexandrium_andersonii.AAC.1
MKWAAGTATSHISGQLTDRGPPESPGTRIDAAGRAPFIGTCSRQHGLAFALLSLRRQLVSGG